MAKKKLVEGKYTYIGDGILAYKKKGGQIIYGCRWREGGKSFQKMTGPNKTDAKDALARIKARTVNRKLGLEAPARLRKAIKLAELCDLYVTAKADKRSIERDKRTVRRVLKPLLGDWPITDIGDDAVSRIKRVRRGEVSGATINRDIALLRAMLTWATRNHDENDQRYLKANPLGYGQVEMEPEGGRESYILTNEEVDTLLEVASDTMRPLIEMAVLTGCRVGELTGLTWGDVSWDMQTLAFPDTKSGTPKYLSFEDSPALKELLRSLQPPLSDGDMRRRHVLTNARGTRIKDHQGAWKLALKNAGMPSTVRFHDLRHTMGTVSSGEATITEVSAAMGHSTTAMTERYVKLRAGATRKPLSAMSKWRGAATKRRHGVNDDDGLQVVDPAK